MRFECDSKSSENDKGIYDQDCTESKRFLHRKRNKSEEIAYAKWENLGHLFI